MAVLRAALLSCLALALAGCFDAPRAQCALSCADSACPDGYECTAAGLCRLAGTAETCAAAAPPDADLGDDASSDRDAGGELDADVEIPALVADGLVVRFFLDEAGGGTGPTVITDAAPEPLFLDLHYDGGTLSFCQNQAGNRCLHFDQVDGNGRASAPVEDSKIAKTLAGARSATIEVVIMVTQAGLAAGPSKLVHIGGADGPGDFSLLASSPQALAVGLQGSIQASWDQDIDLARRRVAHVVLDASREDSKSVALYLDGSLHGEPILLGLDAQINLSANGHLVLGNRDTGQQSFRGNLFYAAVYATALSPAQVAQNAQRLRACDDTRTSCAFTSSRE